MLVWVRSRESLDAFLFGDGRRTAETWRPLSGRCGRRACPGSIRQEKEAVLCQRVCEGGARSEARGHARRSVVGSKTECRIHARQVFDESSRNGARSSEVARKRTRTRARLCLTMDIEGSLVARLQGLSCPSPSYPSHLGAQTRERKVRAKEGAARVTGVRGRGAEMEWSAAMIGG
jgi:hypothetical protein